MSKVKHDARGVTYEIPAAFQPDIVNRMCMCLRRGKMSTPPFFSIEKRHRLIFFFTRADRAELELRRVVPGDYKVGASLQFYYFPSSFLLHFHWLDATYEHPPTTDKR